MRNLLHIGSHEQHAVVEFLIDQELTDTALSVLHQADDLVNASKDALQRCQQRIALLNDFIELARIQ